MNRHRLEVVAAVTAVVICLVGWPLSLVWFAKSEPPFVLSLSWIALIIESVNWVKNSRVHRDQQRRLP